MYKIFILFLGFFLLVSCNNTIQNPTPKTDTKTETTKTEVQKQEISTEIIPFAKVQVENTNEITGVQFELRNFIHDKKQPSPSYEYSNSITEVDQKNTNFLRSHKDQILAHFPEFNNNPTTEPTKENISLISSAYYTLLNNKYTLHSEENPNPDTTTLTIELAQTFNNTYTGSLWDLPLASLYCAYCFEAGQLINDAIIATRPEWMPNNMFTIGRTTHGEIWVLSASPINTTDNTYTKIPNKIIYNLSLLEDIFRILNSKPNPDNSFVLLNILPKTHVISDIIYENGNEKISLKNLIIQKNFLTDNDYMQEYQIELTKNENIIKNGTGKITIYISEK